MTEGVTRNGLVIANYEQIVEKISTRMKRQWGEAFDTSPENPDGEMIRMIAESIDELNQKVEYAYHGYNPSVMVDEGLDNIVRLNGIRRVRNEPTKVSVLFTATESVGYTIEAGTIVATDDDYEFLTVADVVVPGEVIAEAAKLGALVIQPGEVTEIKSSGIPDDITVTNVEAGVTGIIRETNSQLRARRERSVIRSGVSTAEAIYAALADLNLSFVAVLENDTAEERGGIAPYHILVVAEGSTPRLIAERIKANKPGGTPTQGAIKVTLNDSEGYPHDIFFARPVQRPIHVRVRVSRPSNVALNGLAKMQQAAVDHINNIQIAHPVEWARMFAPVTAAAPDIVVKTLEISADGVNWGVVDVPVGITEKAFASLSTVLVEEE
ncbi:baseplate wedge subunit [Shewanella phage SppYZU05]|uniref:Baseplate protein J-like barrel domain-containing protein n=1 Tax=Shewanella phage SppYZU05 TaxID=1970795 RepID=A0A1W6JTD3_9CAUD|nr:baseplate wedge subunit [Shewanella phage SppYZU05]ARM70529.1 hypothetical protein SppYZU05_03 [Shewanella phage SppYZU05]